MSEILSFTEYSFADTLLLRMPAYSYGQYAGKDWVQCLGEPYFKAAISIATRSLYEQMCKHPEDQSALPAKCTVSLWKYANRMRYRPTPFGLCSGFCTIGWRKEAASVCLSGLLSVHVKPDFGTALAQARQLLAGSTTLVRRYVPNPSIYQVRDSYRYLRYETEQHSGKWIFQIQALSRDEYIDALLPYCSRPMTEAELSGFISKQFGFASQECADYIGSLVSAQVVVPEVQASITGRDYLRRVQALTEGFRETTKNKNQIYTRSIEGFECKQLDEPEHLLYVNVERPARVGGLCTTYRQAIMDGLHCLERLIPFEPHGGLQSFKSAFVHKYDKQCLPLLQALDPEIGIGYQGLGTAHTIPAVLKDISSPAERQTTTSVNWTDAHRLLMQKWNTIGPYEPLCLNETDIESLALPDQTLPNSCSVVFRVSGEGVYIEHCGGATATAVAGRFTPLSKQVHAMARKIARQEEEANGGILFAELAYISDMHTANIDRRENLYTYEIPILCGSVIGRHKQLALSDLWIAVEGDQIILWSKKYRQRVIPRLSSAFNYLRSDLAVFRFLCDLQYQDIRASLSLDMETLFPGLPFYPRISYRQSILHLAKWVMTKGDLQYIFSPDTTGQHARWVGLCEQWHLPRFISVDRYDNQLVFDLQDNTDREQLLCFLRTQDKVVVREYIFRDDAQPLVCDENGMPYIHQFIASLHHNRRTYHTCHLPSGHGQTPEPVKRLFVPGSEWLYYKLYMHPMRSNELIKDHVLPCLQKLKTQGMVSKWFFIRYGDPDYHLRIRLSVSPKQAGYTLYQFEKALNGIKEAGIIQSYQLDTYERELERYTPQLMADCENWFCADTALTAGWIKSVQWDDGAYEYYGLISWSIDMMLHAFGYGHAEATAIFQRSYNGMFINMKSGMDKKQLQLKYRQLKQIVFRGDLHAAPCPAALKKQCRLFRETLNILGAKSNQHLDPARKEVLFCDLVHMHLNRLLVTDSYRQEMILYYSLWKYYESVQYLAGRRL